MPDEFTGEPDLVEEIDVENADFRMDIDEPDIRHTVSVSQADFTRTSTVEVTAEGLDMRKASISETYQPRPSQSASADGIQGSYGHKLVDLAIKGEYIYALAGLVLGLTCIISGVILLLNGVAGSTSWTARFLGAESTINDAAPGVVLFLIGLFMVWVTKPKVRLKDIKG